MKLISFCIFLFLCAAIMAFAHGGKKHKKDSATHHSESAVTAADEHDHNDSDHHHDEATESVQLKAGTNPEGFPTIHPLIVHFAIVLIIVAAALQLVNIVRVTKEIDWIVTGILIVGVLAVWLASGRFHPHTEDINDHAQSILDQHDKWADWTKVSSFIGLLMQIANLFIIKSKRWAIAVVALVLSFAALCVSRAGYYGSQLVHIEGIGPQGKYLEVEDHHH